jgi:hypothetical protein
MSFKIQNIIMTNAYLPTQIWVLHGWFKKQTPIFTPKCGYCKFDKKKSNAYFMTHDYVTKSFITQMSKPKNVPH